MLLFILSAWAAPPHYKLVEERQGCAYYTGSVQSSGALPVRAECLWTEVSIASMDKFLGTPIGQTAAYSSVSETTILSQDSQKTVIWQVHTDRRMAPREGTIVCIRKKVDSTITHQWWLSEKQQTPQENHLLLEQHQGKWELQEHPQGGVQFNYESTYLPGGNIPSWLVRQFQPSAIIKMIEETRASI